MTEKACPLKRQPEISFPIRNDGEESKIDQIGQALRTVRACIPDAKDAIPFTHCIPGAARAIYLSWRQPGAPALKPSRWHKQFQTKAKGLLDLLAEMPTELVEDVFQNSEQKSQLYQRLVWALANSTFATPHEAGRPIKSESKRLAVVVANFYFNLTGRTPTVTRNPINDARGGEFYELLTSIFRILEVKDGLSTAADFVREKWHAIDETPGSTQPDIANILDPKKRSTPPKDAPKHSVKIGAKIDRLSGLDIAGSAN